MDNQLTIALIIISLIGFFVVLALNLFFVYLPVSRIEKKFDTVIQTIERTESKIDKAVVGVEKVTATAEQIEKRVDQIITEAEIFALEARAEFEKFKKDLCDWLASLGVSRPAFCDN